jgi:hypothetical protein
MFGKKDKISPMVEVYLSRFKSHVMPNETPLDAGTAFSVGWAMKNGNDDGNGLLVITNVRVFHCIDFGDLTLEVKRSDVFKVNSGDLPYKDNSVLHLHFMEKGEPSYNSFYCSSPFTKDVVRMLK